MALRLQSTAFSYAHSPPLWTCEASVLTREIRTSRARVVLLEHPGHAMNGVRRLDHGARRGRPPYFNRRPAQWHSGYGGSDLDSTSLGGKHAESLWFVRG